jgi:hypothetical protein
LWQTAVSGAVELPGAVPAAVATPETRPSSRTCRGRRIAALPEATITPELHEGTLDCDDTRGASSALLVRFAARP